MMVKTPGTSQVAEVTDKAPMTSAPPNPPMNQNPQYSTSTTARPYTGTLIHTSSDGNKDVASHTNSKM